MRKLLFKQNLSVPTVQVGLCGKKKTVTRPRYTNVVNRSEMLHLDLYDYAQQVEENPACRVGNHLTYL